MIPDARYGMRLFNEAFCRADVIDALETSMPIDEVKREDNVIVKSPDPE